MKRLTVLALVSAAALVAAPLAGGSPAGAGKRSVVDSYCSPTGDYCTGITIRRQRVKFEIGTFAFRGEYQLCVRAGSGKDCEFFRLERDHDVYTDKIDWARHFPSGPGHYKVAWKKFGHRLGPQLGFRVEGPVAGG